MTKNPRNYLSIILKSKIFWHVLKNIAWILQHVCEILKDFGLYFKNIKNLFLARKYIIHF